MKFKNPASPIHYFICIVIRLFIYSDIITFSPDSNFGFNVNKSLEIRHIFVAFSEYMSFIKVRTKKEHWASYLSRHEKQKALDETF